MKLYQVVWLEIALFTVALSFYGIDAIGGLSFLAGSLIYVTLLAGSVLRSIKSQSVRSNTTSPSPVKSSFLALALVFIFFAVLIFGFMFVGSIFF